MDLCKPFNDWGEDASLLSADAPRSSNLNWG